MEKLIYTRYNFFPNQTSGDLAFWNRFTGQLKRQNRRTRLRIANEKRKKKSLSFANSINKSIIALP
ncbi:hypothetical protein DRF60_13235 [Chryseobacterium elymi]|uniref:Uncharacterized protein n=1 Tax=Chryseobacterium elymi TaxID=395936 RepID=A0A3D9DFP7_9FLAO|nr:hypothetical protein DRF60_13235 [Chryseobacterium elymi]